MSDNIENTLNLLVVAYDRGVGRAVQRIFSRENDISIVVVDSLEAARERIAEGVFQVVLTDWTTVNGREVVETARKQHGVRQIIVMSGGGEDVERKIDELGVSSIAKPFPPIADVIKAVRGNLFEVVHYRG